jgi:hypothetical protein
MKTLEVYEDGVLVDDFFDSLKPSKVEKRRAYVVRARMIHYYGRYILANGYSWQVDRAAKLLRGYDRGLLTIYDLWLLLAEIVEVCPGNIRVN